MGILATRTVNLKYLLSHELAPVPTSMFDDNGDIRLTKSKSTMKTKLRVEASTRSHKPRVQIVDGSAILWVITWPAAGTVTDYVNAFARYIHHKLSSSDVYIVFDRYHEFSIKSSTRSARGKAPASRVHKITPATPLPPQNVMLTVTANKTQLIEYVCAKLVQMAEHGVYDNTLIVTGQDPVPIKIHQGVISPQHDLRNTHEEADVIMVHQMLYASQQGCDISVISDDTDVFLLLLHHYQKHRLNNVIMMEATSSGRSSIDIGATVAKHSEITKQLLAAHALTGSDTTSSLYGIGKGITVKVLQQGYTLPSVGCVESCEAEIVKESTQFIAKCYGIMLQPLESMSDVRYSSWTKKNCRKNITSAPSLKSLPPTTEAFIEHVKRSHFQTSIWKYADQPDPPQLSSTEYGWDSEVASKMSTPVSLPAMTLCAPVEVLSMIKCNCATENKCGTGHCSCKSASMSCTVFCRCGGSNECNNEQTKQVINNTDDNDEEADVDAGNDED